MWDEKPLTGILEEINKSEKYRNLPCKTAKKKMLSDFFRYFNSLKESEKVYPEIKLRRSTLRKAKTVLSGSSKKIYGMCPVASPDTLCCRLNTIDAVESCSFGCSYCTIRETQYMGNKNTIIYL